MRTVDRLARLEARLQAKTSIDVPALLVTLGGGEQPYVVEHAGATWTQRPGESKGDLMHRAYAEVRKMPWPEQNVTDERFPLLLLVARRRESLAAAGGSTEGST